MTKISDGYDKKYMKIKFNLDDELPLNEIMEIFSMIIFVRAVFHENSKYQPQILSIMELHIQNYLTVIGLMKFSVELNIL